MGLAIFCIVLFFAPIIIALLRKKKNVGQVVIVNIFLGWTVIGWIISLIMAFGDKEKQAD